MDTYGEIEIVSDKGLWWDRSPKKSKKPNYHWPCEFERTAW